MPFVKGDPNINRKGRTPNAQLELLISALNDEGARRDEDFYKVVAKKAFTSEKIMIAVLKKLVPDQSHSELTGSNGTPLIPPTIIFEAVAKKEEAKGDLSRNRLDKNFP